MKYYLEQQTMSEKSKWPKNGDRNRSRPKLALLNLHQSANSCLSFLAGKAFKPVGQKCKNKKGPNMRWIEKVFRPDAKFARKIKRYKFWLGQFSQILGWPRWRNLTRAPTIKCWVTKELPDLKFSKNLRNPIFGWKNFTRWKHVNQVYFHQQ